MQSFLRATSVCATLLTAAIALGDEAPAPTPAAQPPQQVYSTQPGQTHPYYYYRAAQPQRQSFWNRMVELERRKNNAILRFFGLR